MVRHVQLTCPLVPCISYRPAPESGTFAPLLVIAETAVNDTVPKFGVATSWPGITWYACTNQFAASAVREDGSTPFGAASVCVVLLFCVLFSIVTVPPAVATLTVTVIELPLATGTVEVVSVTGPGKYAEKLLRVLLYTMPPPSTFSCSSVSPMPTQTESRLLPDKLGTVNCICS